MGIASAAPELDGDYLMARSLRPLALAGALVALASIFAASAEDKPAVSLFNGKDLAGWKIYGTEKWYVDGGELICESGPDKKYGYLGTEKTFKDFDLTVEFKQEADGNSGLFFRSSIEGVKISGWQAEIAPPGRNTGRIYESYKRGWLNRLPLKDTPEAEIKALKFGDWNAMRLRVQGGHVQTWLNGYPITDLDDKTIGDSPAGCIALQIHEGGGIKIRWRNLSIKEL